MTRNYQFSRADIYYIFHKVKALFLQKWYRALCKSVHAHEGASLSALQAFENAKLGQKEFEKTVTLSFSAKNTRADIYYKIHKVTSLFLQKWYGFSAKVVQK